MTTKKQFILFATAAYITLVSSSISFASETSTETCANGAGTIIVGKITGHKYCMSHKNLNWWNAHAWCDALGKRLFSLDDCACNSSRDCYSMCPEMAIQDPGWAVTATPKSETSVNNIRLSDGYIGGGISRNTATIPAICK